MNCFTISTGRLNTPARGRCTRAERRIMKTHIVDLIEDNAGQLYIGAGTSWANVTGTGSTFADDAAAFAAGDTADWTVEFLAEVPQGNVVATWDDEEKVVYVREDYILGTTAKEYVGDWMPEGIFYVEAEMLGDGATDEDAARMVELLRERGVLSELGSPLTWNHKSELCPDDVWEACLDIVSQEKYG